MATTRSTRARRFALPDHGDDERTHEAIQAFLEGPEVRQTRPRSRRPRREGYPNTGSAPKAGTGNGSEPDPKAESAVRGESAPKAGPGSKAAVHRRNGTGATGSTNGTPAGAVVAATESPTATFTVRPLTDIRTIPGRLEFNTALERESLRAARYGRPAAVAIVELVPERMNQAIDIWLRSLAGQVSRTLRQGARATDLVARVANTRFQVLLPETPEGGAARFADRVSAACQSSVDATGAPVSVRVTIAAATADHSLQEALTTALESIEAA